LADCRRGDLNKQAAEATIGEWKDITPWWDATPHGRTIRVALDRIDETWMRRTRMPRSARS